MRESSPRPENEGSAASKGHHPLAIVLAADDAPVRPKLRRLLDSAPELEIVAEAGNAESAVEAVVRHAPAALVLDLDRPGDISSLDTIRTMGQTSPATRVIVLVKKDDARFARHALHAGAAACILGDPPGEDLVDAVRRAATERLGPAPPNPGPPPDDLTGRELDVLGLLALGHTNSEIAAQLHLSVRTIEGHRAHLQQKLNRPSRAQLVRYALDHGLLHGTEDPP
jgi:two-component system, NarL family, response regulator NreC